jgi:glycosyltransferase involved in cell wall biosynthesis
MYCGSCLRDNALAAELLSRGHDIRLVPIYTPTLTDEENVSEHKVFFGGISVYLEQHSALFRKTPWIVDRLWDSALALKLAARRSIPVNPKLLGELTISMLKGEDGFQKKEIDKLTHWLKQEGLPDLVTLPNALLIGLAPAIRKALDRPVCCTLQGEDLFLEGLGEQYRGVALELIKAQVETIDSFVAVSDYYSDYMSRHLQISSDKVDVVPLGINMKGYERVERHHSNQFTVGFFARVAPEKGLHVLIEAYRRMRERDPSVNTRLEVAGYLAPEHKPYLNGIERQMEMWGLKNEFHYRGVLDRAQKIKFLQSLDVLSVPATYDEPKGMFLLEAMACGVPVVQPRRGAFPEMLERTGGGLLVEPDDPDGIAEALLSLALNNEQLADFGTRAYHGVRQHYTVGNMADKALDVYGRVMTSAREPELSGAGVFNS